MRNRFWALMAGFGLIATAAQAQTVVTTSGPVLGVPAGKVVSFKGIPFAAPPVGPLRWRAPQPPTAWSKTRVADSFGNVCLQANDNAERFKTPPQFSEDCLTVNVWRPAGAPANLPVMVWIYGGGLVNGSSALPVYDGAAFAKRGVILVSFNYRVGTFGFFAHPALTKEAADGGQIANYGLMDQIAALKWVQANIRAFGGDPRRVTIFGESAGALSVSQLMIMPYARYLFAGAIVESGYTRGEYPRLSVQTRDGKTSAEADGVALMKALGVQTDDPAVLRALPAADIKAKSKYDYGFGFILDGKVVTTDLWDGYRRGLAAPVPLIIGANSLENPSTPAAMKPLMEKITAKFLTRSDLEELAKVYGGADILDTHLSSDLGFGAQSRSLALLHAARHNPAYVYRFSAVAEAAKGQFKGAIHASELPYVFNTLPAARWSMGARDQILADAMTDYWTGFAKTGRPQASGRPIWPAADGEHIMLFEDTGPRPALDDRTDRYKAMAKAADPRS